ncbi:PREDICTED: ras suppressor protein 1-like [Amphimedon queenslandica]|uniref:Disease resistance R13L4/SHOC-2-like LRR domain-containing protein n=1 Tax=Amphimedon queenslandica TaxID=400682 RepID=A0A1X7ULH5_AMPQE|nr:PREDICTED: ras suppressor protein 1-like [Amphimedon queenslandica]|eukprot:XP_011404741.1 PREDICTED: ras suppressor protein 1-like [Amphimedon queenslandica]
MSRALRKAVENSKQKKEIHLADEGISALEDVPELFSARHITKLILSHNKITELPAEISNLTGLEYLNLFNNQLEDLPSTISTLPKLRELNLALNRLCELPRGFGSFPSLQILDMTYNNLSSASFSANFAYLGGCLKALFLGDNDLNRFPPNMEKFILLEVLILRDNDIADVPSTIHACQKLSTLQLQGNQINVLPPEMARLNFLTEKSCFKIYDNPLIEELQSRSTTVKQLFDYVKTEEYRLIYAEFNEAGKFTKVKRDYRSAKKCRNTKRHKVPALSGPGWNL